MMFIPDDRLAALRKTYYAGARVELLKMDDPQAPAGLSFFRYSTCFF